MSHLHPTAVIHPSAQLGSDVHIGPYCVIHEGVTIGDGSWLQNNVTVAGPTTIGKGNRFFSYASIGQQSQDLKYDKEPTYLEIGDHNVFREFTTVNRGTAPESKTIVGHHNNFLAYSHIAHDCVVGSHCIFSNNGTLAGHVTVEDYAILGGLTAIHQFCRVGKHAITGGCSKVVQDVPPFMIVDGNPAATRGLNLVGLQRHGFTEDDCRSLKEAYKILFLRQMKQDEALGQLQTLENTHVAHLSEFIVSSTRGITRN